MKKNKLGIYIHIPFCLKKCLYCDFLSDKACESDRADYVEALCNEIKYFAITNGKLSGGHIVRTVFFGGGTPSVLEGEQIATIMDTLRERFEIAKDAEITIECNPGTATKDKMIQWRAAGINRLSIGLQSANDDELKNLGRIHDYEQFLNTYKWAREVGFENINVDIMSAIPGQTLESYRNTLEKIIELRPEHISAYSLIIEEGTPFYDMYGEGGKEKMGEQLPDEDAEREMYYMTKHLLSENGYHRYEISNYSLEGFECEHNKSYWIGTEYLGFGLGAASYCDGLRYNDTEDMFVYMNACNSLNRATNETLYTEYYSRDNEEALFGDDEEDEQWDENCGADVNGGADENCGADESLADILIADKYHEAVQKLSQNEKMEEFMFLGLRMTGGVAKEEFEKRFHISMDEIYGKALKKLSDEELLVEEGNRVRLTDRGIDVSNIALANFLL